jgi:hypothetical protein
MDCRLIGIQELTGIKAIEAREHAAILLALICVMPMVFLEIYIAINIRLKIKN